MADATGSRESVAVTVIQITAPNGASSRMDGSFSLDVAEDLPPPAAGSNNGNRLKGGKGGMRGEEGYESMEQFVGAGANNAPQTLSQAFLKTVFVLVSPS